MKRNAARFKAVLRAMTEPRCVWVVFQYDPDSPAESVCETFGSKRRAQIWIDNNIGPGTVCTLLPSVVDVPHSYNKRQLN